MPLNNDLVFFVSSFIMVSYSGIVCILSFDVHTGRITALRLKNLLVIALDV